MPEKTNLADRTNMLYAGTHIASGQGTALVVMTGFESEIGKIASMTSTTERLPPQLEVKVKKIWKQAHLGSHYLISFGSSNWTSEGSLV